MSVRRYTRLTNAFSKKLENHAAAVSLHFVHYNFCRKHQTLATSPAVAAGVADHIWKIGAIVELLEAAEAELDALTVIRLLKSQRQLCDRLIAQTTIVSPNRARPRDAGKLGACLRRLRRHEEVRRLRRVRTSML